MSSPPSPPPQSPAAFSGISHAESAFILPDADDVDIHLAAARIRHNRAVRAGVGGGSGPLRRSGSSSILASITRPTHAASLGFQSRLGAGNNAGPSRNFTFPTRSSSQPPPSASAVAASTKNFLKLNQQQLQQKQKQRATAKTKKLNDAAAPASAGKSLFIAFGDDNDEYDRQAEQKKDDETEAELARQKKEEDLKRKQFMLQQDILRRKQRREREEKRQQQLVGAFLACLEGNQGQELIDFLQKKEYLHATQAFNKVKSTRVSATTAVPVCHYPRCRETVMALLGRESESGTFPQSLLSAALTARLGVTVSKHVPESFLGSKNASEKIEHDSFRARTEDRGGLEGQFASMKAREVQRQVGISPAAAAQAAQQQRRDDSEDDDGDATDLSRVRLNDLPGGRELDEFDPVLRDGIRTAALAVMRRVLGPRMQFLVARQRRQAVVGAPTTSTSLILKTHSLGTVHQMVIEALRNRAGSCAPLSFALHQSSSNSSSGGGDYSGSSGSGGGGGGLKNRFTASALAVAQSAMSQKAVSGGGGHNTSNFMGLAFATAGDFSSSAASGGGGGPSGASPGTTSMSIPALAQNYQQPTAPHIGSFFNSFSLEALHRVVAQGTLVVVPANTQLCYQGQPVSTRLLVSSSAAAANNGNEKASPGRGSGNKTNMSAGGNISSSAAVAAAGTGSPLDSPSVIVILSGTVAASVQNILPCGDAGLFISKEQYDLEAPAGEGGIKSVMSLLAHKGAAGAGRANSPSAAEQSEESKAFEQKATLRRNGAFEGFFKWKVDPDEIGTAGGGGGGGSSHHHHHHSLGGSGATASALATVHFPSFQHCSRNTLSQSQPIFPISPLLCRPKRHGEIQVDCFHTLKPKEVSSSSGGGGGSGSSLMSRVQQIRSSASGSDFGSRSGGGGSNSRGNSPPNAGSRIGSDGLTDSARSSLSRISFLDNSKKMKRNSNNISSSSINNNNRTGDNHKLNSASSGAGSSSYNRLAFLRSNLSAGGAVGPMGLPVSILSPRVITPYPVSLRTKSRCELFTISHGALVESLLLLAQHQQHQHHASSSSSFSPAQSESEKILISTLSHNFALCFFTSASARTLSRLSYLRNVSPVLRAAVASAFKPVVLVPPAPSAAGSSLSHFRSSLVVCKKKSGYLGAVGDYLLMQSGGGEDGTGGGGGKKGGGFGGGGGGAGAGTSSASAEASSHTTAGGSAEPLGLLVLPQFGTQGCLVSLSEGATNAEPSIVSVDLLAQNAEESSFHRYGAPPLVQHKLRETGLEISGNSEGCGFALRECFVTAGRRMEAMGEFKGGDQQQYRRGKSSSSSSSSSAINNMVDDDSSVASVIHPGTRIHVFAGSRHDLASEEQQQYESAMANAQSIGSLRNIRRKSMMSPTTDLSAVANNNNNNNNNSSSSFQQFSETEGNSNLCGPILVFVVTATDIQRQVSLALRDRPDEHSLRAEAKKLFADADARLVQYRTAAMTATNVDSNNTTTADGDDDGENGGKKKNELGRQRKTVHELLTEALKRFPLVGPLTTMVDRTDILDILGLLFEFRKYAANEIVLSKTEVAADRVIVLLRGKVRLLGSVPPKQQQHDQRAPEDYLFADEDEFEEEDDNGGSSRFGATSSKQKESSRASNENRWKPLTFANACTCSLPHLWSRPAVAVSEVTTAEANRALVRAFFDDIGVSPVMKLLAEIAMTKDGIQNVPNWEAPKIAQIGSALVSEQPAVFPVLPPVDNTLLLNPLSVPPTALTSNAMPPLVQLPRYGSKEEAAALAHQQELKAHHALFMQHVAGSRLSKAGAPVLSPSRSERMEAAAAVERNRKKALEEGGAGGAGGPGAMNFGDADARRHAEEERQAREAEEAALLATVLEEKKRSQKAFAFGSDDFERRPQPTMDAEALLRSRGVILPTDFFLSSTLDPAVQHDEQQQQRAAAGFDAQRLHSSPSSFTIASATATATATGGGSPSTSAGALHKDINKTHRSLAAGLWMRKRPK